jgi:hypothetical protein
MLLTKDFLRLAFMTNSRPQAQLNPFRSSTYPSAPSVQTRRIIELVAPALSREAIQNAAEIRLKAKLKENFIEMLDDIRKSDVIELKYLAIVSCIFASLPIIRTIEGIPSSLRVQYIGLWVRKLRSLIERLPEYKNGSLPYNLYEILFKNLQSFSFANNLDLYIGNNIKTLSYVREAGLDLFHKNRIYKRRNATLHRQFFIDAAQKHLFATHLGDRLKFLQRIYCTDSVRNIRRWEELEFRPVTVSSGIYRDASIHYLQSRF